MRNYSIMFAKFDKNGAFLGNYGTCLDSFEDVIDCIIGNNDKCVEVLYFYNDSYDTEDITEAAFVCLSLKKSYNDNF